MCSDLPKNYDNAADLRLLDTSLLNAISERVREARTFLFVLSDHGIRHGQYARHPWGTEDAANPVALLLVPTEALTTLELRNLVRCMALNQL